MKRVVAITIILVVVTSLFSFSVFAESPVQPLQVVTYTDTSTQLRISGTAERLHYNVDSFQVVFTNPPDNYGTACTPVLVSFRFYNSSDTPAYVGQAEFEIVCTNGTGSTNLIIYGYDQISTDLFVAESTYSTSEVGRIGIGASNDFAYYTGFVVPPKTSLYFSAIVYVNASAYEGVSNVTGSQEQVNQLTMSSLNLYTNQISFSDAYPYHNQPVDFTPVIEAIETLSDNVSTSTEMQELISMLSSSAKRYYGLPLVNNRSFTTIVTSGYGNIRVYEDIQVVPKIINHVTNGNSDPDLVNYEYYYDVIRNIYVQAINNSVDTAYNINANMHVLHPLTITSNMSLISTYYEHEDNTEFYMSSNTTNDSWWQWSNRADSNNGILLPNQIIYGHLKIIQTYGISTYASDFNPTLSISNYDVGTDQSLVMSPNNNYSEYSGNSGISLGRIIGYLKGIYESVVKPSNEDNTEEAQDMNDEIHEEEQIWYDNNSEALEAVGLSNYRFSPSQSSGITQAVTQFQAVWNALGQWTNVYIFILILSISTYIIRHEPTTRVKQYRSSVQAERAERISYYGKKNAESRANTSGSTLKNAIRRRK